MRRLVFLLLALSPITALAHEAYVLDSNFFWQELGGQISFRSLDALRSVHNLDITLGIVLGVGILLAANFFFRRSWLGAKVDAGFEKLAPYGPLFVRAAIAAAFFYSALSSSFLGPELPLNAMPYAPLMRAALFAASGAIALGFFTELAALAALAIFTIGFFVFGSYLFTYLNYLGEILVLVLFGMRKWSLDGVLFGPKRSLKRFEKYSTTIVRVCYGIALIFAAITVKFLHPALTIEVVKHWNLTRFYWLFPGDPLLVTLGAGFAEAVIGLFILIGFELRLTVLISLFYITLSLLFFRELVWPHLMLYGISLNLLFEPESFTVDDLLFRRALRRKRGA